MDENNVFSFLQSINVDYRRHTFNGDWLNISCPFAPWRHAKGTDNEPSFGVRIDPDKKSVCRCLSCNMKGSLPIIAAKLGKLRERNYGAQVRWAEMTELQALTSRPLRDWDETFDNVQEELAKEFIPKAGSMESYDLAFGNHYLTKRGYYWLDVLKLGLRYDSFQQRILFPIFDTQGRFRGFSGRSTMADKYLTKKNPKARDYFGLDKRKLFLHHRNFHKTLGKVPGVFGKQIIVEGLFAFARMYKHGFLNTNAALGTAVTPEKIQILIDRGEPVYLFLDNDTAGHIATFGYFDEEKGEEDISGSWAEQLYKHVPVWICQWGDLPEGLDPDDITRAQAIKCIESARLYSANYVHH